jgi:hypothetical protein
MYNANIFCDTSSHSQRGACLGDAALGGIQVEEQEGADQQCYIEEGVDVGERAPVHLLVWAATGHATWPHKNPFLDDSARLDGVLSYLQDGA